jgi:hypothetical protein
MAATWREPDLPVSDVRDNVRALPEIRTALERMWPVLTPAQLLHDLFGSKALLKLAATGVLTTEETMSLYRPRATTSRTFAGPTTTRHSSTRRATSSGRAAPQGPQRGAGGHPHVRHIVIDEVQDLTPMQLRMASRRSLNGSMTVVGDIAQATGALAPDDWADVLAHLPVQRPSRVIGLSVGYRIPTGSWSSRNRS